MTDNPPPPENPTPAAQPPAGARIRVEIPTTVTSVYANMIMVSHTQHEIVLDAGQLLPPDQTVCRVQERLILTPVNAKRLLLALADNLRKYEERFGVLDVGASASLADQLFRPPNAPPNTPPTTPPTPPPTP